MDVRDGDAIAAFQRGDLDRARKLAQEQLAAEPAAPGVQHLIGLIECRTGNLESGIEWLRRATAAEPENAAYRVMLARALVDGRRAAEALEVAQAPRGTSPPELALWHVRAEAATAVEAWPAAAEAWDRMSAVRPTDCLVWSNLGNALGEMGHWPDAAQALERAVALNPADLPLRRNLAGALNNASRFEDSVEEFRRCIKAAPADKSLHVSLAAILADLGRDDESRIEFDKAAQLAGVNPVEDGALLQIVTGARGEVDVASLRELADLLERSNRLEALGKLLDDVAGRGVAVEQIGYPAAAAELRRGNPEEARRLLLTDNPALMPLRWHWLMARIEDAVANSGAAFAEAEAMNRAFPDFDHWRRQGAEQRKSVRQLANAIKPASAAQLQPLEADARGTPAFIVGFPRSGTTLLDTFLRGHPDTEVLEELPTVRSAALALGTDFPQRSLADLMRARDAYFEEIDRQLGPHTAKLLIDKLPLNMLAGPVICSIFPDARLIFAQRHPCDAVLSCFMQAFTLNDSMASFLNIEDAADFYDAAMTVWTRSCEALPLNVRTVVYEELVVDPEAVLRPAIEFLGLDWRPKLLDHRATAKARGRINTPSYNQVIQPLNRAPSGRWRRYKKQLEPVLPVLLPWAKRLGYED